MNKLENIEETMRALVKESMMLSDANIHQMIHIRTQLSGYSVYYAGEVGNAKTVYLDAKSFYESVKLECRFENLSKGIGLAEAISRRMTLKEHELLNKAHAIHNKMELSLRQYNEVLSALSQRISFAKEEWKKDNT